MNEKNKLTLEDCFKYPKAKINDGVCKISLIGFMKFIEDYRIVISDCKLQLRPISSLTEEEKKHIEYNFNFDINFNYRTIKNITQLVYEIDKEYLKDLYDYLRSINIDIDGLQESGVAIYE